MVVVVRAGEDGNTTLAPAWLGTVSRDEEVAGKSGRLGCGEEGERAGTNCCSLGQGRANCIIICRAPPLHRKSESYLIDARRRRSPRVQSASASFTRRSELDIPMGSVQNQGRDKQV